MRIFLAHAFEEGASLSGSLPTAWGEREKA
jgi:hypothetical protein